MLFDAGLSCLQIRKRLESVGEDYRKLDAVIVSHEHSDHVRGLEVLERQTGVKIYTTPLTGKALTWKRGAPSLATFEPGRTFRVGDLEIGTFTVSHDAIDPVGFVATHRSTKISIVTDLGYMTDSVRQHISDSDLLVLESNHDLDMLKSGPYPWDLKQRVMSRHGHLSNTAVAEYLGQHWDRRARTVVLAHLSRKNNLPVLAEMNAKASLESVRATGTRLMVAEQDSPTPLLEV